VSKKKMNRYNKKFAVDPDLLYLKMRDACKESYLTKRMTVSPLAIKETDLTSVNKTTTLKQQAPENPNSSKTVPNKVTKTKLSEINQKCDTKTQVKN